MSFLVIAVTVMGGLAGGGVADGPAGARFGGVTTQVSMTQPPARPGLPKWRWGG